MSGIAGIFNLRESKKDRQKINILLDKISHRGDRREVIDISGGYVGINSNYSFETKIDKNIILVDGKIYNLDYLLSKHGIQVDNSLNSDSEKK